jgi:Zinc finger, C2H2 type
MDKHDRPYKCREPGCEKLRGFTYSGGLSRHQKEVHKKHKTSEKEIYCPYPHCNRNTSQPFTRRENLKEHIRRRHVGEDATISPSVRRVETTATAFAEPLQDFSRKRKRTTADDSDEERQSGEEDSEEDGASEQNSRLRKRIRQLEKENRAMKEQLSKLKETLRLG